MIPHGHIQNKKGTLWGIRSKEKIKKRRHAGVRPDVGQWCPTLVNPAGMRGGCTFKQSTTETTAAPLPGWTELDLRAFLSINLDTLWTGGELLSWCCPRKQTLTGNMAQHWRNPQRPRKANAKSSHRYSSCIQGKRAVGGKGFPLNQLTR